MADNLDYRYRCAYCTMSFDVTDGPRSQADSCACPECGLPFQHGGASRKPVKCSITAATYEGRTGKLWLDGR
jgi:DNA-directed RNA polymerase subunit RPC12/RpoP